MVIFLLQMKKLLTFFSAFISIKYGRVLVEENYKDLIEGFPELKGLISFVYDYGGNLFLLSTRHQDFGNTYIWLMDEAELDFVADSFSSFLKGLDDL
ncbi:SMI1/KNR4 family protein [Kosakonia cowanii]|uniref:SMI1/KNR4 family protein n=1 Tax=Kosakonia sp. HypNH10 TaxID=2980101 RepID=UPI002447794D|nr:SMI1/KNR4 family protein [Kosakonia sp. HypNH10]MDH2913772.1 SMI1/KNR4 family protein [Kosakonia sp. HypNH10]